MAITSRSAWANSRSLVALLAVAVLGAAAPSANAQYRYVPSRDYYRNDTAEGTVLGGAFGAITGAIVGGKKNRGQSALIGAGVGALTGNLLGRSKDRFDAHQAATESAVVARANRQAAARAVTNFDLIRLTQAGVGEDVIISTIRARGARLDLSPEGLIALKESGVSDPVLIAAQKITQGYRTAQPPPSTILTRPAPSTVIVTPHPRWIYPYPPRYYHHDYHHDHHRRASVHYRFGF